MREKDASNPDYYQELVHKLATGTITPAEKQLLEQWYNAKNGQIARSGHTTFTNNHLSNKERNFHFRISKHL